MAMRKTDFTLPTLDDLFTTQEMRDDAKLERVQNIPLSKRSRIIHLRCRRLKHCNLSTIPKKGAQNQAP